jgi:hypothetical protein
VIAKPDSTTTTTTQAEPAARPSILEVSPLSATELYQLTLYKWRYSLEAYGFAQHQIKDLMFIKWLHATRRVMP